MNGNDLDKKIKELPVMQEFNTNAKNFSESNLPMSAKALATYSLKLQYISNSINLCKETGDYYSLCILFRSLLEHYFRHLYIYTRALEEDNDNVGIEYYGKLNGHEDLSFLKSNKTLNTKLDGKKSIWNLGGEHNENLDDIGRKFKINSILAYLNEFIKEDEEIESISRKIFNKYSQHYARLSSFVHGGPFAEKYIKMYSENKTGKEKDMEYLYNETNILTNQARRSTSLFIKLTTLESDTI